MQALASASPKLTKQESRALKRSNLEAELREVLGNIAKEETPPGFFNTTKRCLLGLMAEVQESHTDREASLMTAARGLHKSGMAIAEEAKKEKLASQTAVLDLQAKLEASETQLKTQVDNSNKLEQLVKLVKVHLSETPQLEESMKSGCETTVSVCAGMIALQKMVADLD